MKAILERARAEIGTVEWEEGSNPKVIAYYRDAGHPEVVDDAIAWCAAFVGAVLQRSGHKGTGSLLARSYLKWGTAVPIAEAMPGDIGIIPRGDTWQGHVFFIDKIANGKVYALGGNQRDSVNITTYPVASLIGVRRARKPTGLQTPKQSPETCTIGRPSLTPVPPKSKAPAIVAAIVALVAVIWAWLTRG